MTNRKIMLCGGGTGGHVLPLVAVARAVKKIAPEAKIYFVGPEEFPLDSLREEGVIVKKIISAGKLRRYFSWFYVWELIKLPFAFLQSFFIVLSVNPDVVLGKGSYGSVWPVVAAEMLFKKIIIHESDAVPGLANRFLSYLTDNIAVSFEETKKFFPGKNVYIVGNPVRLKYLGLTKEQAQKILNLPINESIPSLRPQTRYTIFISGGSQGAQKINRIILESLDDLLKKYFVIWSTGSANYELVKHSMSDSINLKVMPFLNERELAAAYTLCDLAIGRAGAGTIFELAAFAKPAILIPLERNGGDQPVNARAYAQAEAAIILKESDLNLKNLLAKIESALNQSGELSRNAKKFAKIDAAEELAKILLNL
ncbi:MAG: UDP-N-acetylglucosamine--N-acetylmuramyl-(pentapeptide) pyrophosphoryl-undecaprenol N-acetylglucosamine transferase [Patescibacteria group bacterium]